MRLPGSLRNVAAHEIAERREQRACTGGVRARLRFLLAVRAPAALLRPTAVPQPFFERRDRMYLLRQALEVEIHDRLLVDEHIAAANLRLDPFHVFAQPPIVIEEAGAKKRMSF